MNGNWTNSRATTRSRVTASYALIAPDSHVAAPLAGWQSTSGVILISPRMGAGFCQYLADLFPGSRSDGAPAGVQRFLFVLEGRVEVAVDRGPEAELPPGGYAWFPPDSPHRVTTTETGCVLVFEKTCEPLAGVPVPEAVTSSAADRPAEPFRGDPDARLQTLLSADPGFDLAVNIFTCQPGATLSFVEVHVMERGLLMLSGGGVYWLDESWYPVPAGDAIWIVPYCAQWFVAAGKQPASYIYYKDVNRDPLAGEVL